MEGELRLGVCITYTHWQTKPFYMKAWLCKQSVWPYTNLVVRTTDQAPNYSGAISMGPGCALRDDAQHQFLGQIVWPW
jgi:hypothetical protein